MNNKYYHENKYDIVYSNKGNFNNYINEMNKTKLILGKKKLLNLFIIKEKNYWKMILIIKF